MSGISPDFYFVFLWFAMFIGIFCLGQIFMTRDSIKLISEAAKKKGSFIKLHYMSYSGIPLEMTQFFAFATGVGALALVAYFILPTHIEFPSDRRLLLIALFAISMFLEDGILLYILSFKKKYADKTDFRGPNQAFWTIILVGPPVISYIFLIALLSMLHIIVIIKVLMK